MQLAKEIQLAERMMIKVLKNHQFCGLTDISFSLLCGTFIFLWLAGETAKFSTWGMSKTAFLHGLRRKTGFFPAFALGFIAILGFLGLLNLHSSSF